MKFRSIFLMAALGASSTPYRVLGEDFQNLERIATQSLQTNLRSWKDRSLVTAGDLRFRSYWTRDFAFAASGLITMGRPEAVQGHIQTLLEHMRVDDGALPRNLSAPSSGGPFAGIERLIFGRPVPRGRLVANFGGGGESALTIDSNALILLAAAHLTRDYRYRDFSRQHFDALSRVFSFYLPKLRSPTGLIDQPPAADWQDSVRRQGHVLFVNALLWAALKKWQELEQFFDVPNPTREFAIDLDAYRARMMDRFTDSESGLLVAVAEHPYIALEDQLILLKSGFFGEPDSESAQAYFARLKRHAIWTTHGLPGRTVYPEYPDEWIVSRTRSQGLRHYHDRYYWPWIMALAAEVSSRFGDRQSARHILTEIEKISVRDGTISEVLMDRPPFRRWSTVFLKSEKPFAWAAGMTLDALREYGLTKSID